MRFFCFWCCSCFFSFFFWKKFWGCVCGNVWTNAKNTNIYMQKWSVPTGPKGLCVRRVGRIGSSVGEHSQAQPKKQTSLTDTIKREENAGDFAVARVRCCVALFIRLAVSAWTWLRLRLPVKKHFCCFRRGSCVCVRSWMDGNNEARVCSKGHCLIFLMWSFEVYRLKDVSSLHFFFFHEWPFPTLRVPPHTPK